MSDSGTSDIYVCSRCERQITQSEIDDEFSEAFDNVCGECALQMRAEMEEA